MVNCCFKFCSAQRLRYEKPKWGSIPNKFTWNPLFCIQARIHRHDMRDRNHLGYLHAPSLYCLLFFLILDVFWLQFIDPDHGEWFGYLSQEGNVTLDFKGGPYKGMSDFSYKMCTGLKGSMLTTVKLHLIMTDIHNRGLRSLCWLAI